MQDSSKLTLYAQLKRKAQKSGKSVLIRDFTSQSLRHGCQRNNDIFGKALDERPGVGRKEHGAWALSPSWTEDFTCMASTQHSGETSNYTLVTAREWIETSKNVPSNSYC